MCTCALFCYKMTQSGISMAQSKTAVTPLLTHWSYCSLALSQRYEDGVLWDLCNRSIVASWYHTSAELVTSFVRLGPDGTSVMFQMLCSMKQQFAVLLSDIGFISEGLTTRAMERHGRYGTDGVAAVTGTEVGIMASWDWGELVNTLGLKKTATIFQTLFSNTFSWMKIYEFWLRFHWSLFVRVQLTTFQHWFR